ncbi:MAG: DUF814 domain-containing protein [Candidatus Latescibacteria bacterium]|nr:DUF814 domain-containing protein [Candidatus Latescibacterota bacterium]NIM22580.1 DUF814 domain-containing protein [Candidatus Latescibacterota bacterium]NIM64869.1 DUF814 domain-containing protein [Candidatus Latescibacterota bacterium]NIO01384.1 DUF814 domain-containing protein [Candidatus Latescibacterota bacterium]NIO27894.1 DUF814 domain-containing protein [Candidatus Latescibacterota bacterium]
MNHFLLHLLLPALQKDLIEKRIAGIAWLEPIFTIMFTTPRQKHFVAFLTHPGPFCFLAEENPIADCNADIVLEAATGARVTGVSIPAADRTLLFALSARRSKIALSLSLYGTSGRAVISRDDRVISTVGSMGSPLTSQDAAPGMLLPLATSGAHELAAALESGQSPRERFPGLEPELIDAFALPSGDCDVPNLLRFRDGVLQGKQPFSLAARRSMASAFPIPPSRAVGREGMTVMGPFEIGEEACRHLGERLLPAAFNIIVSRRTKPIRKRLASRKALCSKLQNELEIAKNHSKLRRETEALAAYQSRISPRASHVELPNPYEPTASLSIALNPSIPLQDQIRKRFKKAAKLERSVKRIRRRLREIEGEIQTLQTALEADKASHSLSETLGNIDRVVSDLGFAPHRGRTIGRKKKEKQYRRFDLDPVWFVLVGRNNQENDEITFRIAGPNDLWLHAQNVPGSHVVLKSRGTEGNPPARVLEAAAGIAAFYSRSRYSSLVPVVYTRRKYVRKPKKASPGKVICEREKTIFAEPILPTEENPRDS